MSVTLTINGKPHTLKTDPETPLLWALRDELRLTGSKYGCGIAQCGACTVMVDGYAQRSCVTPLGAVDGATVETIEGLDSPTSRAVQAAWASLDVPQCGYCQSGQVVSATALLKEIPNPTDEDIDNAMSGNACRCATYVRIRAAIHSAAKTLEG